MASEFPLCSCIEAPEISIDNRNLQVHPVLSLPAPFFKVLQQKGGERRVLCEIGTLTPSGAV